MAKRIIIGEQDAYMAFASGLIAVINGRVTWIDPSYDGRLNDVKRAAQKGSLRVVLGGLSEVSI
jgi:hypothetical protein